MSAADRTIEADRIDLASLPTKQREGYVGLKILPVTSVSEKAGTTSAQTITTDAAVVAARAAGAAVTATLIANSDVTFTCASVEAVRSIDERDVPAMGGINTADYIGGRQAKHEALKSLDAEIKTLLFTGTPTNISADVLGGLATAADAIAKYEGKITLVLSKSAYRYLASLDAILERLALSGFSYSNPGDILAVRPNVIKDMLSQFYAVDDILVGNDDTWKEASIYTAALCVVPDATNPFFFKEGPALGTTFQYMPDGKQPFEINSWYDSNTTTNRYRALTYSDPTIINAAASKYLRFDAAT